MISCPLISKKIMALFCCTKIWPTVTYLYMVLILVSSMTPGTGGGGGLRAFLMNLLHIPEYGLLTFLLIQALRHRRAAKAPAPDDANAAVCPAPTAVKNMTGIYTAAALLAVAFGVLNEFVQAGTPGREYSVGDMLRNAIGAGLMIWIYARYSKVRG